MVSISDILKVLDRIPIWKGLIKIPARLRALEKRVAELEAGPPAPKWDKCPKCKTFDLRLESSEPDAYFANMVTNKYRCFGCGHELTREETT